MKRTQAFVGTFALLASTTAEVRDNYTIERKKIVDPSQVDRDFAIQGEIVGEINHGDDKAIKWFWVVATSIGTQMRQPFPVARPELATMENRSSTVRGNKMASGSCLTPTRGITKYCDEVVSFGQTQIRFLANVSSCLHNATLAVVIVITTHHHIFTVFCHPTAGTRQKTWIVQNH